MIRPLQTLKSFFKKGLYPTQEQFHDTLDSFIHKNDKIGLDNISQNVLNTINAKAEQTALDTVENRLGGVEESIDDFQEVIDSLSDIYDTDENGHAVIYRKGTDEDSDEIMLQDDADSDTLKVGNSDHNTRLQGSNTVIRGEIGAMITAVESVQIKADSVEIKSHEADIELDPNATASGDVKIILADGTKTGLIKHLLLQSVVDCLDTDQLTRFETDGKIISSDGTNVVLEVADASMIQNLSLLLCVTTYTPTTAELSEIPSGVWKVTGIDTTSNRVTAELQYKADKSPVVMSGNTPYLPKSSTEYIAVATVDDDVEIEDGDTITGVNNTHYKGSTITSLTFNDSAKNTSYWLEFSVGSTAPTMTFTSTYKWANGTEPDWTKTNVKWMMSVINGCAIAIYFE